MARFQKYNARGALIEPTKETINGIEQAIRWAEYEVPAMLHIEMNKLAKMMALVNQSEARKMSFGPYDPSGSNSDAAWKIPVRRITNTYYLGWKVRPAGRNAWQLYNDSREAYFIEFGINWLGEGRRVRRPIRKMSLRKTMEYMMTTQAFHRIFVDIFANSRHRHRGRGFTQIVQAPAGGHERWEDISQHDAESVIRGNARKGMFSPEIRRVGNKFQRRVRNHGSGTFTGPLLGRRLP